MRFYQTKRPMWSKGSPVLGIGESELILVFNLKINYYGNC